MTFNGMKTLLDTLMESNSKLTRLDLSNNQLDDDCMESMGEYIQDNQFLENVSLNRNKISDRAIKILSEYLVGNTILKSFSINDNQGITEVSAPLLIEVVKKSCIEYFDESGSLISREGSIKIHEALKIPIDQREIPIKSSTKSAAKIL